MQSGKVLLVGHSYGASYHDKVAGLVYIAAFAPDKGESLSGIFARREQPSGAAISIRMKKDFFGSNMINSTKVLPRT